MSGALALASYRLADDSSLTGLVQLGVSGLAGGYARDDNHLGMTTISVRTRSPWFTRWPHRAPCR